MVKDVKDDCDEHGNPTGGHGHHDDGSEKGKGHDPHHEHGKGHGHGYGHHHDDDCDDEVPCNTEDYCDAPFEPEGSWECLGRCEVPCEEEVPCRAGERLIDDVDDCEGTDDGDADGDGVCDGEDVCDGDDGSGDTDGDGVCDDVDRCDGDDASGGSTNDRLNDATREYPAPLFGNGRAALCSAGKWVTLPFDLLDSSIQERIAKRMKDMQAFMSDRSLSPRAREGKIRQLQLEISAMTHSLIQATNQLNQAMQQMQLSLEDRALAGKLVSPQNLQS